MNLSVWQQISLVVGGAILFALAILVGWCQIEAKAYEHWDRLRKWLDC